MSHHLAHYQAEYDRCAALAHAAALLARRCRCCVHGGSAPLTGCRPVCQASRAVCMYSGSMVTRAAARLGRRHPCCRQSGVRARGHHAARAFAAPRAAGRKRRSARPSWRCSATASSPTCGRWVQARGSRAAEVCTHTPNPGRCNAAAAPRGTAPRRPPAATLTAPLSPSPYPAAPLSRAAARRADRVAGLLSPPEEVPVGAGAAAGAGGRHRCAAAHAAADDAERGAAARQPLGAR